MRFYDDDDDDLYDEDDYEDDEDDDDDETSDEDDETDDEDVYETLEYNDTCQIQSRSEIIADIKMYLRRYQPLYKIVRKKDN